ncbi:MAG: HAMP domain-containing sensor histidine kinase [Pseudomonadota bacterium]
MTGGGLNARLGRLFAIQLAVIGAATLIGIYITQAIVEDLLTRQALVQEAEYFWDKHDLNPRVSLPDTANLTAYLRGRDGVADAGDIPAAIAAIEPGYERLEIEDRSVLVHVTDRGAQRLYLVFEGAQVSELAFFFGLLPLSIVLLLMYAILFLAYRWSRQALSPIVALADRLEAVNFERSGSLELELDDLKHRADSEVALMIDALDHFTTRLDAAVDRERVFTRDAGHELRTPVAVFKGTLDLLEERADRPAFECKALARMRRTVDDMEALLETLLMLAREEETALPAETVPVNQLLANQIDTLAPLAERADNTVVLHEDEELEVLAPVKVVEILLGNLLRNALTYTQGGKVEVFVRQRSVTVADTGIGMSREQLEQAFEPFYRAEESRGRTRGHGLGLSIVRRLSRQFGWRVSVVSQPDRGTEVTVAFAGA